MTTGCPPLHIPYKDWSGQQKELENYLAIERWTELRCGGGCSCFLEHKSVTLDVPLNEYTPVVTWDGTFTCGTRPTSDAATTILLCNWRVLIEDYTDDATPPFPNVRFGYGVYVTQGDIWIAGSHGFIDWDSSVESPWQASIANLPPGVEWPDALTSGSFAVPINVAEHGFPVSSTFEIAAVLGVTNPAAFNATFHIDTYEYSLCGCECQE